MYETLPMELIEKYTQLESYTFASTESARIARKVYAYIRKHRDLGYPIYIQNGKHTYTRLDKCTPEQRAKYLRRETAKLKSLYFDTIKPLKQHLSQEELEILHEGNLFKEVEAFFE